jgi:SAM-dependent methyltransferase
MKMHCLNGRILQPELLDTLPAEEARPSLNDLVRINKYWGGHSTLRKLVQHSIPVGEQVSLLDVGAATGDMGQRLREWRPQVQVTSLDYIESHLAGGSGTRVAADAFALPFAPRSFDYVFSSLFLHHFTDNQVVELLSGFGRVARRKVLIIDLWRHPVPYYFISQTRWLFGWDPVTVHDGAISVEAAFDPRELVDLARRAGLENPETRVFIPAFRIALSAGAL